MARPAIRAQLDVALRTALQEKKSVELRALRLDDDATAAVDITVQAVVQPRSLAGMAMIVFRDVPAETGCRGRRTKSPSSADPGLTEELLRSREETQALRQETHASQEELQAANEELQSTNEELQSANEELMTSKCSARCLGSRDCAIRRGLLDRHTRQVFERCARQQIPLFGRDVRCGGPAAELRRESSSAQRIQPRSVGIGDKADETASVIVIGAIRSWIHCSRPAQRRAACVGIPTRCLPAAVVLRDSAHGRGRAIRGAPPDQTVLQFLVATRLGQAAVQAASRQDARTRTVAGVRDYRDRGSRMVSLEVPDR